MWFKLTLIETEKMFYSISKWQFMNIHYSNILNSVPFRIMLAGAIQNPVYDSNLSKEVTTLRMRFFSVLDSWSIAKKKIILTGEVSVRSVENTQFILLYNILECTSGQNRINKTAEKVLWKHKASHDGYFVRCLVYDWPLEWIPGLKERVRHCHTRFLFCQEIAKAMQLILNLYTITHPHPDEYIAIHLANMLTTWGMMMGLKSIKDNFDQLVGRLILISNWRHNRVIVS